MCVIIACERVLPSEGDIRSCWKQNSDGAGVAWMGESGKIFFRKGLSLDDLVRIQFPLPCVYHFRMATVGGKSPKLSHPFVISEDSPVKKLNGFADRVLFHNGHIHNWRPFLTLAGLKTPKGPLSDSRALAMVVAKTGFRLLKQLSDSNKFAVLARTGIHTFGQFTTHAGCKFSNMFWGNHWTRTQWWDGDYGSGYRSCTGFKIEKSAVANGEFTAEQQAEIAAAEADDGAVIDPRPIPNNDSGSQIETASFPDWTPKDGPKRLCVSDVNDAGKDI